MYIVTKKAGSANMLWDAKNDKVLCEFNEQGILETEDTQLAEKLRGLGFAVEGEKAVEKMTVAELKEYAAANQIDLGEAAKKEEILAVVQASKNA